LISAVISALIRRRVAGGSLSPANAAQVAAAADDVGTARVECG
jgi:hypothetical protein